ncbi:TIGR03619 family F420-dependent LLM class oxidoreductase [Amycolatopsis sp. NPDC051372]|uniref:TIGR03619 family F420-dependent LLM class oxidoreductase n=1 Tax=Amycolatopsis sp. NPDC051372 TaxID=3155669 RepID=UPI00342212A1
MLDTPEIRAQTETSPTAKRFPKLSFGLFPPILYPISLRDWEVHATPADLVEIGRLADELGYAFIACGDHGALAVDELRVYGRARFYDPVATLGFLAATTDRIGLVTLVYQAHLRSPLIAAKELATVDHLSGGRLIAGFGVGSRRHEADAAGVDFDQRGAIVDDHIKAIEALWRDEVATYHGKFVRFDDVLCEPRPSQLPRPPIWIGGNRLVGLRRALRLGDGWAPFGAPLETITDVVAKARSTPEWESKSDDFRIVAPLAPLGGRAPRGEPAPSFEAPSDAAAERVANLVTRWTAIGATDFIIDLPAPSLTAFTEALAWFAEIAAPAAGLAPLPRRVL